MNLTKLREQTPATQHLLHLNNAGAALTPQPVMQAILDHLQLEQELGAYEAQEKALEKSENFYHAFARMLNCNPREIAYAESASRAWTLLFQAIPLEPGDRIITSQTEYASNFLTLLHIAKKRQITLDIIPDDASGQLDIEELKKRIDADVRLIAITHIPSQTGRINPAEEVGRIARKHRILYLLDACQSAGQMDLDVNRLGCDMLIGTGRKYLRGPRGTGFMYVRHAILDYLQPTTIDLHSAIWVKPDIYHLRDDARRFEQWESFLAGKIGLASAVDYALSLGLPAIEARVQKLAAMLRARLNTIKGVTVHDQGDKLSGICTFSSTQLPALDIRDALRQQGTNLSVVRKSNAVFDFEKRALGDICRASVHYYNTEQELDTFYQQLDKLLK
ncbi:MAG: aminotransferase class V-fold PLP-dependent enzyme [Pseudomonadales bacterium]|nr:aminotransferase class V-fold PLP-dependent enzyme [Pseudomonadales bacterium]